MIQPKKTQRTPRGKSTSSQPLENLTDIQSIQLPKKEQPRRYFAPDQMEQLITSIKAYGILEPLIVRPLPNGNYELVAGERRLRAAKAIGLTEVPIVVRDFSDEQAFEVSLLENLQRDDLNPIDETEGLLFLLCQVLKCGKDEVVSLLNRAANVKRRDAALTNAETSQIELIDQLFKKVGRLNRESFRTNRLPLLNMPEDVLVVLRQGELEYTKAKAISRLERIEQRKTLMEEASENSLSLTQIKERIQELKGKRKKELFSEEQLKPHIEGSSIEEYESSSGKQLRNSLSRLSQSESHAWNDKSKQKALKKVLSDLERLLQSETLSN
jgi:ParB family transcriptional regulator, chromosome partitioning protein